MPTCSCASGRSPTTFLKGYLVFQEEGHIPRLTASQRLKLTEGRSGYVCLLSQDAVHVSCVFADL